MQYEDEVRKRISMLRFLMIFGVVLLHTPPFVPIKEVGGGTFDLIKSSSRMPPSAPRCRC